MAKTSGGGGKADATLVAAAYRLGQSYIPADYSTIFNKQYEGLIAAYQAKYKAIGDTVKTFGEGISKVATAIEKRQTKGREIDDPLTEYESFMPEDYTPPEERVGKEYEEVVGEEVSVSPKIPSEKLSFKEWVLEDPITRSGPNAQNNYQTYLSTDLTFADVNIEKKLKQVLSDNTNSKMNALANHLENGGTFGDLQYDATEKAFRDIKTQLEVYNDKAFLSKDDKRQQSKLRKQAAALRGTINEAVGAIKSWTQLYKTNGIDLEQSFEKDYESRDGTIHQGADLEALVSQVFDPDANSVIDQFELFYSKNGQRMYRYAPGRAGIEYNKNKGIKGKKVPKSQWKTISEKALFGQITPIDEQTVIDANSEMTRVADSAEQTIKGGKTPVIASFDDINDSVYSNYLKIFNNAPNIRSITTRDILVGKSTLNYKENLNDNWAITTAVVNQIGIGSDILTVEQLANWDDDNSGKLEQDELEKHEKAKEEIIEKLTNPQTQSEKKAAAMEFANYWTHHAKTVFDDRRTRMNLEPSVSTDEISAGSKFGLNLKKNYYWIKGPQGTTAVDGATIENSVETFKAVQDKGSGTFTGYDDVPHVLKNGKWTRYDVNEGKWVPDNAKSIFTSLKWDTNPKIMAYLKEEESSKVNVKSVVEKGLPKRSDLAKPPNVDEAKWKTMSEMEQMAWYLKNE